MVVLKCGGTSVGEVEAIRRVVGIVAAERRSRAVVVSALAGVTDSLLRLHDCFFGAGERCPPASRSVVRA